MTLNIRVKEYVSGTLARCVRGALYDVVPGHRDYALYLLASGAPDDAVIVASSLKTHVDFVIATPHKDCKAKHEEPEPQWWTTITARAFPSVATEHRSMVRRIGEHNHIVKVPVVG